MKSYEYWSLLAAFQGIDFERHSATASANMKLRAASLVCAGSWQWKSWPKFGQRLDTHTHRYLYIYMYIYTYEIYEIYDNEYITQICIIYIYMKYCEITQIC